MAILGCTGFVSGFRRNARLKCPGLSLFLSTTPQSQTRHRCRRWFRAVRMRKACAGACCFCFPCCRLPPQRRAMSIWGSWNGNPVVPMPLRLAGPDHRPAPQGKIIGAVHVGQPRTCSWAANASRWSGPTFSTATDARAHVRRESLLQAGDRYDQDLAEETHTQSARSVAVNVVGRLRESPGDWSTC